MPTTRRRHPQEVRVLLEPAMREFFRSGSYRAAIAAREPTAKGFVGLRQLMTLASKEQEELWRDARTELVREWIVTRPGTRPFGFWQYEAREPRRLVGGRGRAEPNEWFWREHRGIPQIVDADPENPPRLESESTYLRRHGLLDAKERARLTATDFEPEILDDQDHEEDPP